MSVNASKPLRWGICGAGKICHDFVGALRALPSSDHQVVSVAARDLQRAQDFANRLGIENAYGSYEELAADPSFDIVYIGVIHLCHVEVGKLMLNAGKHVLCEKPMTMNRKQTQELVDLARKKGLFLMEAAWTFFFPLYDRLLQEIENDTIGKPMHVTASFTVNCDVLRISKKALGGSTVIEIGIYPILFAIFIFGEEPEEVKAVGYLNDEGCDEAVAICMKFGQGRLATLSCDMRYDGARNATVYGTNGKLEVQEPFHCPTKLTTPSETIQFPLPKNATEYEYNFTNSVGLRYEADAIADCIRKGATECATMPHSRSLLAATILDDIRNQIGVVYDFD